MRFLCVNILTGITHTSVQDVVHIRWCSSRLPVIRPVSPVEQEQLTLPEHLRLILVFVEFMLLKHSFLCGILQIIVCFFCSLSFWYSIICTSSICDLWLYLWHHHTFLILFIICSTLTLTHTRVKYCLIL